MNHNSKIFIPLISKNHINNYLDYDFDAFIIGINDYSVHFNYLVDIKDLDDIISIIRKSNKKIYISFDRLYYNNEINNVKDIVKDIINKDIDGIMYTDIGVLNILNELGFNKDIIWNSNHIGTNSKTVNFLGKRNVNYALLSTEITIDEIISIKNNSNINIGVFMYGLLNMATSSRKLLTNYFKYINKIKDKDIYRIKEMNKDKDYLVVEKYNTDFYTNLVLNGIKYYPRLLDNNIDFIILDNYLLDEDNFLNVLKAFLDVKNNSYDEIGVLDEKVNKNTSLNTFDGFLDKKSVYKVKDYGKN